MEVDQHKPGHIIYTDKNAVKTTDGTTVVLLAGNSLQGGYREGRGAEARFYFITGFTQISDKHVVVSDCFNRCLRLIDRTSGSTSQFSGQCQRKGYADGNPGLFDFARGIVVDLKNVSQLLLADEYNQAVRSVDVGTGAINTFARPGLANWYIRFLTQDKGTGDLYVQAHSAIYKITYLGGKTSILAGSPNGKGFKQGTLLNSLFNGPHELIFVGPATLLVADANSNTVRLLDIHSDKVSLLYISIGHTNHPTALLLTNNSLYVGQRDKIQRYACK